MRNVRNFEIRRSLSVFEILIFLIEALAGRLP
jgi:hypothetical protein